MTPTRDDRGIWNKAVWTVPLIWGVGSAMGIVSASGPGNPWYDSLTLPTFQPPGWAFGVAWSILYVMLGLLLATLLDAPASKARSQALRLFGLQMLLNYSWSPVFFQAHDMALALKILAAMIVVVIAQMVIGRKIRPLAAGLLIPYLAWLGFATALNVTILANNPGANQSLFG